MIHFFQMWVYIIIVIPLLIAAWMIRRRWLKVKNYWADRGVPHAAPHPILGSLTFLQKQNMVTIYLTNLCYVTIYVGNSCFGTAISGHLEYGKIVLYLDHNSYLCNSS